MLLTDKIAQLAAKPTPSRQVMQMMNRLSNPSAENVLPTVVLEGGTVSGRTLMAWLRSGFLEAQERALEEISVAMLWFWGVGWMEKLFDRGTGKFMPKAYQKLDTTIGWTVKQTSLALHPLESHAFNALAAKRVLTLKGIRLGFSVATAIGLIALAVPWLNQKKTEWIIRRFYHPKKPSDSIISAPTRKPKTPKTLQQSYIRTQSHRPFQHEAAPYNTVKRYPPFFKTGFGPPPGNDWPASPSFQYGGFPPLNMPTVAAPGQRALRFGRLGEKLLNQAGHWIQDTDLGRMFVLDTAIIGGRAWNAAQRSPLESVEVVVRDTIAYYFYFMAAPHVLKFVNFMLKPLFGVSLMLEPMVAEAVNQRFQKLTQRAPGGGWTLPALKHRLLGSAQAVSPWEYQGLAQSLRSVSNRQAFLDLFRQELGVYFPSRTKASAVYQQIHRWLGNAQKPLHAYDIAAWMTRLEQGNSPGLAAFSRLERQDVVTALKHAFGTTVGQTEADLLKLKPLQALQSRLSPQDWAGVQSRLQQMAGQDHLRRLSLLLRRNVVLATQQLGQHNPQVLQAETFAKSVEYAVAKGVSNVSQIADGLHISQKLQASLQNLESQLSNKPIKSLFQTYQRQIQGLLDPGHAKMLYALETGVKTPALTAKLEALLLGGLARDSALVREGLAITGALPKDARQWTSPHKLQQMQHRIQDYLSTFLARFGKHQKMLTPKFIQQELQAYFRLNRNLRYGAYSVGLLFGMAGLGYIIPKIQYGITTWLSGTDTHPGIHAVMKNTHRSQKAVSAS